MSGIHCHDGIGDTMPKNFNRPQDGKLRVYHFDRHTHERITAISEENAREQLAKLYFPDIDFELTDVEG